MPALDDVQDLPADAKVCARLQIWAQGLCLTSLLVSVLVLLGWTLKVNLLTQDASVWARMKPNAAVSFVFLSLASLRLTRGRQHALVSRALCLVALAISSATLSQDLLGWNLGIDQVLMDEPDNGQIHPGRMSPAVSLGLILLSLSSLSVDVWPRRKVRPHQSLALGVLVLSGLFVLTYLYNAPGLQPISSYPMTSLTSGISSSFLAVALLFSRPAQGFMAVVSSNTVAGIAARRFLPALFFIPAALGLVQLRGQELGFYGTEYGLALMALTNTVVLVLLSLIQFNALIRSEFRRGRLRETLAEKEVTLRNEARIRSLYASLQDAIITSDAEQKIVEYNDRAELLFNLPEQSGLGLNFAGLWREQDRIRFESECLQVTKNPSGRTNLGELRATKAREYWAVKDDGSQFPCEVSLSAWKSDEGVFCTAVIRDISRRKANNLNLRRLAQIIEASEDGIGWADLDGKILYLNPAARTMLAIPLHDNLTDISIGDLRNQGSADKLREEIMPQVRATGRWTGVTHLRSLDGHEFPVLQTFMILRSEDETEYLSTIFRDIQEQQERERALTMASYEAESASRAKSEFLANMSHELRTPLNAILGFSEILIDQSFGPMNAKQLRYANNILNSGRHLLHLINDLLDISKIESGKMELQLEPISVNEMIREGLTVLQPSALAKNITVACNLKPDLALIHADAGCVKQIILNLLSNAIKYTPPGGRVELQTLRGEEHVEIHFIDNGVGVKAEDQQRIFEKFEQADNSYSRSQEGTGLGLALTQSMVRLHGGELTLCSEGENRGSTFTVKLPLMAI